MTKQHKSFKTKLAAFIPHYIPNLWVAGVMGLLGMLKKTSKKQVAQNLEQNEKILTGKPSFYKEGEFIENQPFWGEVRFGKEYTMAYGGCEIFAVHNALLALGEEITAQELARLISQFERKGAAWAGKLGIAPMAAYHFFRKRGYQVSVTRSRKEKEWYPFEKCDTIIVTAYNDGRDIFRRIHTVNISKDAKGDFYIHNGFVSRRDGKGELVYMQHGPFKSLTEALQNLAKGKAALICMIGIVKEATYE